MRATVQSYMTPTPHTIGAGQPVTTAREMMRTYGVRHLPVLEQGRFVGMLTEHDLDRLERQPEVEPSLTPVRDAMTDEPCCCFDTDAPLELVLRTMASRKLDAVLLLEEGLVKGIFTATDAEQALAQSLRSMQTMTPMHSLHPGDEAPTSTRWGHVITR